MIAQGGLMTDDRSMVYVGGRITGDNRKSMREQQDYEDAHKKKFPGVHYEVEIKNARGAALQRRCRARRPWTGIPPASCRPRSRLRR